MVYILACLFSVHNTINLSRQEHVESGPMMEEVSLKTVSLNIYIIIYVQTRLKIKHKVKGVKICQNIKPTTTRIPSSVQLNTWGRLKD